MGFPGDLKNCRVLIREAMSGKLLADTLITDFDRFKNVLKIRPSSLKVAAEEVKPGPISALVFGNNTLYEYYGILRVALIANEIEVSLSGGKTREDRKNLRYEMQLNGKVEGIILEGKKIFLRKPIEVISKNISGTGVLIQTMAGALTLGDRMQLMLELHGKELRGDYEVMRMQNCNLWTEEYGCRNVTLERGGESR